MNAVMYATVTMLDFIITPKEVLLKLDDKGPGIENIALALKEGYSTATEEMREMGFGAGMGLPNIKKNADEFVIKSKVNEGTSQLIKFNLNSQA
jgi:anti-sigma regulatory factor (Ser/Thr protein kinase)